MLYLLYSTGPVEIHQSILRKRTEIGFRKAQFLAN